MSDHYVQAQFLGLWSITPGHGRSGQVYAFDRQAPERGWFQVGIERILAVKGGDKLTPGEVKQLTTAARDMKESPGFQADLANPGPETKRLQILETRPLDSMSLETDVIQPIEQAGYRVLVDLAQNPQEVRGRPDCNDLALWVLLHSLRTPRGKKSLAEENRVACSQDCGREITEAEYWTLLQSEDCRLNYLFYSGFLHGRFNLAKSGFLQGLHSRRWAVRAVLGSRDLICGDNPICNVMNQPKAVVVPLGPRMVLFGYEDGPGVDPQPLTEEQVRTINALQRMSSERWMVSREPDPDAPSEEELVAYESQARSDGP